MMIAIVHDDKHENGWSGEQHSPVIEDGSRGNHFLK
jgi:hypothetical protein